MKRNNELSTRSIFFDPFFDNFFDLTPSGDFGYNSKFMKTDITESDDNYKIEIDVPGFKKEQVAIDLDGGYLTVSATKEDSNDEKSEGKYIRRERCSQSIKRSFYVGDTVSEEDISAKLDSGILEIVIPKKQPKLPEKKQILIK